MIRPSLDTAQSILYVHPKSALEEADFAKLAEKVDPTHRSQRRTPRSYHRNFGVSWVGRVSAPGCSCPFCSIPSSSNREDRSGNGLRNREHGSTPGIALCGRPDQALLRRRNGGRATVDLEAALDARVADVEFRRQNSLCSLSSLRQRGDRRTQIGELRASSFVPPVAPTYHPLDAMPALWACFHRWILVPGSADGDFFRGHSPSTAGQQSSRQSRHGCADGRKSDAAFESRGRTVARCRVRKRSAVGRGGGVRVFGRGPGPAIPSGRPDASGWN